MSSFKMKMTLTSNQTTNTTTETTTTTTETTYMKMGATTTRTTAALNVQGNKFCKSCNDKN
jgi:hypothetical protein